MTTDLGGGGAERQAERIFRFLDRTRFAPRAILFRPDRSFCQAAVPERTGGAGGLAHCPEPSRSPHEADLRVLSRRLSGPMGHPLRLADLAWRTLRESPDVVLSFHQDATLVLGVLARVRLLSTFVIGRETADRMTFQSFETSRLRPRLLFRLTYAASDLVLTNSRATLSSIHRGFGVPARKTAYLPNLVEPSLFETAQVPETCRSWLQTSFAHPERPLVLWLSRFAPGKGIDVLVRAHARLRTPANLLVLGEGPQRGSMTRLAEELGLAGKAAFPGFRADADDFLSAAAVFVMPSRSESMSNSLLEAMARARPVAAARIPSVEELVRHEENGLLCEPGDHEGLAQAIDRLLAAGPEANAMGLRARETVRHLSADRLIGSYEQLFLARGTTSAAGSSR